MRPNQRPALAYVLRDPFSALFMDMRLGKTLVAIRGLLAWDCERILIVAPYSALRGWDHELALENQPGVVLAAGTREERLDALSTYSRWTLTNKEAWRTIGTELAETDFDAVVLDESPFVKNPKAGVTKYFIQNFRDADVRMILSGLPAPEGELEYHQQLTFLDSSILGEPNFYKWRHANFTNGLDPTSRQWFVTKRGKERIARALATRCFFQTREEWNLEGERIEEVRTVVLPKKVRKAYRELEETYLLELEGWDEKKTVWDMTKYIWLRRLAGGVLDAKVVHDLKLKLLLELLTGELAREPVIIWAWFREEIAAIFSALREVGIRVGGITGGGSPKARDILADDFDRGDLRVLVCQPEATKYGANFSRADVAIYYSLPCGLDTFSQSRERNFAVGKTGSLLELYLITEDTVDEDILKALRSKKRRDERMRMLVDAIRRRNG